MLVKQRNRLFNLKVSRGLKLVYVHRKGLGLFGDKNFKKGETVIRFKADRVPCSKASPEAVRISEKECFDTQWLVPEAFINHSCFPNTRLDVEKYSYVAIRNIKRNDEITFNYITTDWDMENEAFQCFCGSKNCYGWIRGLKYLPKKQQKKLKPYLLPFLQKKVSKD